MNWSRARKVRGTIDGRADQRREQELAALATWIDQHGGQKTDAGTKWIAGAAGHDAAGRIIAAADRRSKSKGVGPRAEHQRIRKLQGLVGAQGVKTKGLTRDEIRVQAAMLFEVPLADLATMIKAIIGMGPIDRKLRAQKNREARVIEPEPVDRNAEMDREYRAIVSS